MEEEGEEAEEDEKKKLIKERRKSGRERKRRKRGRSSVERWSNRSNGWGKEVGVVIFKLLLPGQRLKKTSCKKVEERTSFLRFFKAF